MTTSDEELAKAAAQGDAKAFSSLLSRHYDRIFRLAFRLTGTHADAEDMTQDICTALPGKIGGYRGQAKFTTWLYRLTVNACHDRRRRMATYQKAASGWGDWEIRRQADIAEGAERADWLSTAMMALGDDLRDTLALVLDDMTHAEAGQVLGVSEGTISWRVSQARRQLRALKEEEEQ